MKALSIVGEALFAALVLVLCEALATAWLGRAELAGPWELRSVVRVVPVLTFVLVAPAAVLGAALRELVLSRRRVVAAGIALVAALAVGFGVTTGRHFAAVPVRAAFVGAFGALVAAATFFVVPPLGRAASKRPALVAALGVPTAVLALVADEVVLPRLYPAFHLALACIAGAAAGWAVPAIAPPTLRPSRVRTGASAVAVALVVAAAAFAPRVAASLGRADNVKFVLTEKAPLGRYGVALAGRLAPDEARGDDEVELGKEGEHSLDLSGRDLVVISIDALRADHVGAYGYGRGTTPNIDALAKEGAVFEHAYTATPHTSYAVTSLMTGKYMRPLLLAGSGAGSDTFAKLLRTYGYRTAAFYPPAVFFIDEERFTAFRETGLDFEYRRVEFLGARERAAQVATYLAKRRDKRVFLWVHLFEPHEPYERHEKDFGDRDVDRYDGEIFEADAGVGAIVAEVRKDRPQATIVVTADHGEEFGEHGGRYHGTTVYEEQVRVPLVVVAPGKIAPGRIAGPVQTVDILPTVLSSLAIPRPARVRGRDLSALLAGKAKDPEGGAFAETDEQTLYAEGSHRLVCQRRAAACQLFDLEGGPGDVGPRVPEKRDAMRKKLRDIEAAHGRYEQLGLRREGKAWPEALRRGIAGDADAAVDVAALLDDADVTFRRKAAEVLFDVGTKEVTGSLRLALGREDDETVKRWCAVTLTRLGEGSAKTLELVAGDDLAFRRVASLALAEQGDKRGEATLLEWLEGGKAGFTRDREILRALAKVGSRRAAPIVAKRLPDVRLRPYVAETLAELREPVVRPALLEAFQKERYAPARVALGRALTTLGAGPEMAPSLVRFLGVPDPPGEGLAWAERAKILVTVGGPDTKDLDRLRDKSQGTVRVQLVVPKGPASRDDGTLRLWVRGKTREKDPVAVRIGPLAHLTRDGQGGLIELDGPKSIAIELPAGEWGERHVDVPAAWGLARGKLGVLGVEKRTGVEVSSIVVVPLAEELPPPPKEPWTPGPGDSVEED